MQSHAMKKKAPPPRRRKSAADALRESEERWKFALEGAGEGVWDWDVLTGRVVFSKRWKEMLGFGEKEVGDQFKEWEKRVHPEDLAGALAVVREHLAGLSASYTNEFRMLCKDGSWKWILARGMVTSRDGDGRPLRAIGTHTDISAEKAAKEREAANLRLIVEDAPLASVLEAIVHSVEADHPAMCCAIMLVHAAGDHLVVGAGPSLPDGLKDALSGMPILPDAASCGASVHAGERVIVPDIHAVARQDPWREAAARAKLAACWSEPIVGASGKIHGAFTCFQHQPHTPNAAEISVIASAAQLAALAVEREERKQMLRQSEERYRRIVQTAEEGILAIDAEARIDFVNPKMAHMLGYCVEDMTGRPVADFLDDEGRAILAEKIKLRRQGIAEQFEFRFPRRDGSDLWTFISTNPIMDADGTYLGALGMFTDITQHRHAEAALRESEARYARAVRGTSEGLWDWNILTGEDYLSPRWKEMLGYADAELRNHENTFFSLVHPDDVPRVQAAVKAHLERCVPFDIEIRLRTKGGGHRWFRSRGEAERDAKGNPVRMAGSISDIMARKEAEAALRESEQRFRAIFEQAAVGVAVIDSNTGRFLLVNQRSCDIARLTREQMTAATFMDITHPDDLQPDLDNMAKLKAGIIRTFTMEKRYLHPNGAVTWINLTVSPMWRPGEAPSRHIAVVEDITERKRLEKEIVDVGEREQQRIGYELHDDLCQRLASIKLRFEMLTSRLEAGQAADPQQVRQLWCQLADANHVARSIAKGLSPIDAHPEGLMSALSMLVSSLATIHELPCLFHCPEPVMVGDRAAAAHLYRIAQELINNAARHAGPARIDVRLESDPDHVRLEVENDGVCFAEPAQPGPGMGLRILHFRANAIGATVQFLPRPGGAPGTLAVCLAPQSTCNPGGTQKG